MIEKVIPDKISFTLPTVFGEELTFLEFCGKLRAKLNECIDVVNDNTSDIQQNTTDIQQNTTDIQQNTTKIQQNTSDISKNESSIAEINTAFNILRTDFLKQKAESLFAPVILNVEPHSLGADINASVYVRLGRISYNLLGCLYAKVNLSFTGNTDAKTLKIVSVQFGKRSILALDNPSPIFTAKTDVINLPISVVGTEDIPAGTSDIAVTGLNFLGASENISDISSAITLEYIPTGRDILCESLTFTSPAGGEEDSKLIYTFKASEGCFDIFATAAGISGTSVRAYLQTDFTNIMSDSKVFAKFLCSGGVYNKDTISTISSGGAALGAAMMNYTEYAEGSHLYNARITLRTLTFATGASNSLKNTGIATQVVPFGGFAHVSLTFDMFN